MSHHARLGRGVAAAVFAVLVFMPATARAANPVVTTGNASEISQTTAVLQGSIDPNSNPTIYFFRFGTTSLYGAQTADTDAGSGGAKVKVKVPIAALAPFTKYHFQLVARTGNKVIKGKDQTFKTKAQPLGLTLGATPNPVKFNGLSTLAGNLAGTGNAGREVELQFNPYPYTQGFLAAANRQVVDAGGNFAFPILHVPVNTQYRVLVPDKPEVVSPTVTVGVKVGVGTKVKRKTIRNGKRVRFYGKITPSNDGAPVAIQRRFHGVWVTVAKTTAKDDGDTTSRYSRRIKVRRSGLFRVLVTPGDAYVTNAGRTVRVRIK